MPSATEPLKAPSAGDSATAAAKTAAAIPDLRNRIPKLEPRRRRPGPSNPTSYPETPSLPPPPELSTITFQTPSKRILSKKDHDLFLASPTYTLIQSWIFTLSDAVANTPIPTTPAADDPSVTPTIHTLLSILTEAEELVRQSPPDDAGGSRFGNKRFRDFLDAVRARAPTWHARLGLPSSPTPTTNSTPTAADECTAYLLQSFGNRTRIDYGSGHELNFLMYLLCLNRLRILPPSSFPNIVLRIFPAYLHLMRLIQTTYYLEPAGSHGVWGLDDYQFLPFLFGASQLASHATITPRAVHSKLTIEEEGGRYMYLGQVSFVNATKTVEGLRWHSPMLDDISAARDWKKVEGGMRRMFVAEVLGKLPVMQHFLFGGLIPAAEGMSEPRMEEEDEGEGEAGGVEVFEEGGKRHLHQNGWGECCGIKVPSGVAAVEEMRKRGVGGGLRRIPFD